MKEYIFSPYQIEFNAKCARYIALHMVRGKPATFKELQKYKNRQWVIGQIKLFSNLPAKYKKTAADYYKEYAYLFLE